MLDVKDLTAKATLLRKWELTATTAAGSGHPTSSMSATDLSTVLFDQFFTYDIKDPYNPHNDRFILSKGHASPLYYALWAMSGAIKPIELLTLRQFTSQLEGHPTPEFAYTDAATGSLGQGLSVGVGLSYLAKKEKLSFKTYVVLGDGETAEGQVWEAANFAAYYNLTDLIAIVDVNRLGQSQQTMFEHHLEEYVKRFSAFGFETVAIDGHDFKEIYTAFEKAQNAKKPFAIIARTLKGKGVSFLEDSDKWHGKALKKEELEIALSELGTVDDSLRFSLKKPIKNLKKKEVSVTNLSVDYTIGEEIATREVYGTVLAELGKQNSTIYSLDGDVKNSTFSLDFKKVHPERFVECFIAEQNMVSLAVGMSRLSKIPFVSTFAAFLTRAADQIRMAGISHANIKFVGSHAGVSIGEDGSSQMGLEDIALFGTIPQSVILHPSDAVSTAKLLPEILKQKGITYLRTLRPKTKVIYKNTDTFVIGGSKILRSSENDVLTIVAAGITVPEALKAAEQLEIDGIHVRVIDCYSVKPVDQKALLKSLKETKKQIVISVEDHYENGGLGDFVLSAVSSTGAIVEKMAVRKYSHSGKMNELLDDAGISAKHIVARVKKLIK